MNNTSLFNIKIDFNKSHGSFIYDKTTQQKYLDFMGMYSSLPIGYNHPIFDSLEFEDEVLRAARLKIVNCEILSDEFLEFNKAFKEFTSLDNKYSHYHYTCTGALANEAAIKTAMWYKSPRPNGYVLALQNSFHGINSVGNLLTTRFTSVKERQGNLPGAGVWPIAKDLDDAIRYVETSNENLQGVIIEPIQATYGDNYLDRKKLFELREACTHNDIPLIFDEVQTGFCTTGKVWYSDKLKIYPDILVFGKKSQVSGIMVKESHSKVFEVPKRLSVTFDGDLIDMIRCKYIIKAIVNDDLLTNADSMGTKLHAELCKIKRITNVRSVGLLIAFDFRDNFTRNSFVTSLKSNNMMCNPTGEKSIRLRPNLAVAQNEVEAALELMVKSLIQ